MTLAGPQHGSSPASGSGAPTASGSGAPTGAPATRLDPEDAKLVTLARGARGRGIATAGSHTEGAAVRDEDGRTYAAATVDLPSLRLTAAQAAVAAAVASGARALEALAVVGAAVDLDSASAAAAADLHTPVIILAAADGTVRSRTGA